MNEYESWHDSIEVGGSPGAVAAAAVIGRRVFYGESDFGETIATDLILARNNATAPLSALRLITPLAIPAAPPAAGEGGVFGPAGEGESRLALGSSASTHMASLDGVMAAQQANADQPMVDAMMPSATFKLLRRFGSAAN